MKNLPSFVRGAHVQQGVYARSEVRVQRRASVQQRGSLEHRREAAECGVVGSN